jgi:hypothetical protein
MYSTASYLYQQITQVLTADTDGGYFIYRYNPVYAKTLTINKGVDNVLLFELLNQEQRPVNVTESQLVFRLIDQTGTQLLAEYSATVLDAAAGRIKVVLPAAATTSWLTQSASYSLSRASGNYTQAVYVDANSQARGQCNIVDSVYPQFVPSIDVTIPQLYGKNQYVGTIPSGWPEWAQTPQPINTTKRTEFYSSHMPMNKSGFGTVQFDLAQFSGTVKVQAADDYLATWKDVTEVRTYAGHTGSDYINVVGFYPLLRLAFTNAQGYGASAAVTVIDGSVVELQVLDSGQDYTAPPMVEILGNGSGAVVQAVINDGRVTQFQVLAGGTGYTPTQYQSTMLATANITNGKVENIRYR